MRGRICLRQRHDGTYIAEILCQPSASHRQIGCRFSRIDRRIGAVAHIDVRQPVGLHARRQAAGGRFLLQTRDGVGKCTPHDGPADVKLGLGELAMIYMGAHRASELHRANRITELRSGALRNLDAAFATERVPYCGTLF